MPTLVQPKSKRKGQATRTSPVFHIRYYCPVRRRSIVISTLCKRRKNAERCLREFCDLLERGQVGIRNPFVLRRRLRVSDADCLAPDACLESFETDLRAGRVRRGRRKPVSPTHAALVLHRVRKIVDECQIRQVSDLTTEAVNRLIDRLQAEGEIRTAQTRKHYERAIKSFSCWLVNTGRLDRDPLSRLVVTHVDSSDVVHSRGAFRPEEIEAIAAAARTERSYRGLSGLQRSLLYVFAASTGFRAKECAAVRKSDFGAELAFVHIAGEFTKNGKDAVQPVPSFLGSALGSYLARLDRDDFLWPGGWQRDEKGRWVEAGWITGKEAGEFLRQDAAKVGIVIGRKGKENNGGRVLDFHSFRHSYISALGRAGISEGLSRKLARASCQAILERYTHREFEELTAAVETMPVLKLVPAEPPPESPAPDRATA